MIISYIKKNKGGIYSKAGAVLRKPARTKKGIMIAVPVAHGKIHIGWSLCNFSKDDEFGDLGMRIAMERASSMRGINPADSMVKPLIKFVHRARKYYKDKTIMLSFPLALGEFPPDRIKYIEDAKEL